MAWTILTNWIFLCGVVLVLGGLALQIIALSTLSLGVAVPIFVSGLVPLSLIAITVFGERLSGREWLSLLLVAAAMLLLALSIGTPPKVGSAEMPGWQLALVVTPALAVPLLLMVLGDHRPDGRHARPVAGVAYGLSAGFPVGAAEVAVKGWSEASAPGLTILQTPYPYVTVLSAVVGFAILQVGFQRCRVIIVATVMTISAKIYLLLVGTTLYGEPWPKDGGLAAMRVTALALGLVAVLLFPRYERDPEPEAPAPGEPPPWPPPWPPPGASRRAR
ncbi:hypothetical protein DPM19_34120 [Actinomadura craniellae]|uniref:Uncharacterized protein n=1 Tax=Actinomadura craniellae TaxID=2231787 RepID=A0A365GV74_9ACTN|nr:hypothetical protein [Actinomadura craniellae]RAY10694.1 hypothetical protein DPM19_34120 [Actinomadura craniellae]